MRVKKQKPSLARAAKCLDFYFYISESGTHVLMSYEPPHRVMMKTSRGYIDSFKLGRYGFMAGAETLLARYGISGLNLKQIIFPASEIAA